MAQVDGKLSTLRFQREALENVGLDSQVQSAMSTGAKAFKAAHRYMDIDQVVLSHVYYSLAIVQVHDLMDDIREQQEASEEISEAIARPIGTYDIDEDDIEAQLKELEQQVRCILYISSFQCTNSGTQRTEAQRSLHRSETTRSAKHLTQSTTSCTEEGRRRSGQIGGVVD